MVQPHSSGSDSDGANQVHNRSIGAPAKIVSIADSFEKRHNSWFVTSQIPTDLSIQVQDITFHVHKNHLVSRCGCIAQVELQPSNSSLGCSLKLENFPGGSETFEIILKFCYDFPINLDPKNVAALRCASEFLEMTEALEDGNLISKTEAFLTFVVLSSWRDTITVLKTCETLTPWAENLQIVRRCCDSIARKASQENPTGEMIDEEGWWFEDIATFHIDHFLRIIRALRAKRLKPEIIGSCIKYYAGKWLPGMDVEFKGPKKYSNSNNKRLLNILSSKRQEGNAGHKEQRMIVESLVSILPPQKEAVSCKFLLAMLKTALAYSASPALISELERRVGMVLENADVNDLLVPNCTTGDQGTILNSPDERTMHNIDVVQRIVEYFLMEEQQQKQQQYESGKLISKLLDNYLAEIAKDPNLSIIKFQALAEALPENARTCHDGLYRATDTYIKSHPSLSKHERRRLCKILNCEKLSVDACIHAAQNDRLPQRTVIQILFSEQVKMRAAMQGREQTASDDNSDKEESSSTKEIKILKAELEKVQLKVQKLQRDYTELQKEYEKLNNKERNSSVWTLGWKKLKNSSIFNGKADGEETRNRRQRLNSGSCHVSFRQRPSV